MGEIAEMMLDVTLCEACGTYIGSNAGIRGYCSAKCARDRGVIQARPWPHAAKGPPGSNAKNARKRAKKRAALAAAKGERV